MRICVAQTRVRAAALEQNFVTIRSAVEQARRDQADVVVFPEMALPGYFLGDAWERPGFLQRCENLHQQIADLSRELVIVFGSVGIDHRSKNEDGRVRKYNAAFVAQGGKLLVNDVLGLPFWPKTLLPNYREFDDSRHFFDLRKLALEQNKPLASLLNTARIQLKNGQTCDLGIGLCEDAWDDDYAQKPYEMLFTLQNKPQLLINLSCSPFTKGKQSKRLKLFRSKSQSAQLPMIYVNAIGSQNVGKTIFTFDGHSGVYLPQGFLPVGAPFQDAVHTFDLAHLSIPSPQSNAPADSEDEILSALENALRFVREEWNLEKTVIGISGGIDSALSAVLHARVFGPENTICINLPSKFNSSLTINAARELSQNLGCQYASLSIEDGVTLTLKQISEAKQQGLRIPSPMPSLVPENIQARDRGARLIAAVAAATGSVFPCNANKSELTVGYSTLYGDQAGYLAPLADLWKGDVYSLARHYNSKVFGRDVIPQSTLTVVPSAELSSAQDVTQGQGDPLHYPYHDALFRLWVEEWNRFDFDTTLAAWEQGTLGALLAPHGDQMLKNLFADKDAFVRDLSRWWNAYIGMGAFKRVQAPPVLAITRRAFGFDHRESIGLHLLRGK